MQRRLLRLVCLVAQHRPVQSKYSLLDGNLSLELLNIKLFRGRRIFQLLLKGEKRCLCFFELERVMYVLSVLLALVFFFKRH